MSIKYFKYVSPSDTPLAGIKTNNYSSCLTQILEMAEIAKQDFPGLTNADIHTVAYDGDRWKRQTGIEFPVPKDAIVPDEYARVAKLEYVFAGNG